MTEYDDPPLQLDVDRQGETEVIVLRGELDPHTSPALEDAIDKALGDGVTTVVIDLAELVFIDSSGLRVLIRGYKELSAKGGDLVLRSPSETARRLLEITDLLDRFTIEHA